MKGYIAYPAEPLLCIKPELVAFLFNTGPRDVFGYWDIEGRKLSATLTKLCAAAATRASMSISVPIAIARAAIVAVSSVTVVPAGNV